MASIEPPGLCRRPSCYRIFKGARGLSIHLGQSIRCNTWYKAQAQDHLLSRIQPDVETVTTAVEGIQGSPVPWSSTLKSHRRSVFAPRARQSKSVTVEDDDSDDSGMGDVYCSEDDAPPRSKTFTKFHPTAGKVYGKGRTILQEIDDKDKYKTERKTNVYYPFMSRQDFEMGAWLSQSNASMSQIDDFLKLSYVRLISSINLPRLTLL